MPNILQYTHLDNPMDRGAWQATVGRVEKRWTRMKQFGINAYFIQISLIFKKNYLYFY